MNFRLFVLVAGCLAAQRGLATPADTYGALPAGVATAGAGTANAEGAEASFYNPAGLGLGAASGKTSIQIGYSAGVPFLSVDRKKSGPAADRHPTREPPYRGWETVGAVFPLGGMLKNKVALGMLLYHPQDKLVRVQAFDPRSPQFLRYQAGVDRMELDVAFGARIGDYVSIGAGVHVLAGLEGEVDFDVDLFDKRVNKRDLTFDLITKLSPSVGIILMPTKKLRLGLSFRGSNELAVSQPNVIGLGDLGTLNLVVEGTVHYTPQTFSLGASFDPFEGLRVAADVRFQRWSQAPYPAMRVAVGIEGEIPEGLGLDEVLTFGTNDPEPGFRDIAVPAITAEYTFKDKVTKVRGGYALRPSYVPDQVHQSNFLDNTANIVGLGATFQFSDPTKVFTKPLKFDVAAQGQFHRTREVKKRQGADVVGDYTFGGFVLAAGAALRYEF